MHKTKMTIFSFLGLFLIGTSFLAKAQDKATIEKTLTSQYTLTKTTADKTDIVTAGAILVLKKDNLMMVDVSSSNLFQNTYKDGKITQNALGKLSALSRFHPFGAPAAPTAPGQGQSRTFVAGEKMWVTNIELKDSNNINVELYTDAINDVRYRAVLDIQFKGPMPSADQALKMVGEVFDVQPADDSNNGQQQAPAGGNAQPAAAAAPAAPEPQADAPLAAIPPPPPPADEPPAAPKEISLGQKKEEVIANFGQPKAIAKVGTKEIYTYPDLKVTFVNGKVTDVQ